MPGDRHLLAGRLRSQSEARTDSVSRNSESEPESEPHSDSESETLRRQPASRRHLLLVCPGCNKPFTNITSLRRHRSSWWMADSACRNAAHKRPRTIRRDVDAARDADDRIRRMMGDGSKGGPAAGDAQRPFLQPRDEVGPGNRDCLTWSHRFTQCLQRVFIRFASSMKSLHRFALGLHHVCSKFNCGLYKVCTKFTLIPAASTQSSLLT